ncbi:UNKNOWN [Stylonychia lemnae]|uniref:Uncharacterized protein n=1 Tax=Stylonychia lemnae TaxID=5949 RepID=A0A078AXC2_STYLE|nr:UNKNOWN [Stylonychia lemnae]|eukprot:CDW85428.1 UNKNOWN [Stylonychia lemnae]
MSNLQRNLVIMLLNLLASDTLSFQTFRQEQTLNEQSAARSLQTFTSGMFDCQACFLKSTTASYCLQNTVSEYCCNQGDTNAKCQTNSTINNVCSPTRIWAGNFFLTYCKGAGSPPSCGVDSLELIGTGSNKTVTVSKLPYKVSVQNTVNYLSCYYHLKVEGGTWKDGAKIKVVIQNQSDVRAFLYGGNSRTNASLNQTTANASLIIGQVYSIDISTEAMLVVLPVTDKADTTTFKFSFQVVGTEFNYWEKLIYGPNGFTYYIVGLTLAGVIGLLILLSIIWGIIICCKRRNKVENKDDRLDETTRKFGEASVLNDGQNQTMLASDQKDANGPLNSNGQPILEKPWSGNSLNKDQFYKQPYKIGIRQNGVQQTSANSNSNQNTKRDLRQFQ